MGRSMIFLVSSIVLLGLVAESNAASFNVMSYGAVGDGKRDDSQAFLKAWTAACKAPLRNPILVIPARTFLLYPAAFNGPCKSSLIYVQVLGTIIGPASKTAWRGHHVDMWLSFVNVNGLRIGGKGRIDGRGSIFWPNRCFDNSKNKNCDAPTTLTFKRCNNLQLSGLTHINAQRAHIVLTHCNAVTISNINIIAPESSPNTDGIDISGSTNVRVRNSRIGTGDDCIAISGGTSRVNISGITCGPGHGISIGALGHGGFDAVEDIHVKNSTFIRTLFAARIKTWQGGSGYARKISYANIRLVAVNDPILIDQYYCPSKINCKNSTSAVKVSDVTYTGFSGTSSSDEAITLKCSQSVGCTNIKLDRVYIRSAKPGRKTTSFSFNAHGKATHTKPSVKGIN